MKPKSTHIWLPCRDSKPREIDGKRGVLPLSHDSFFFSIVNLKQLVLDQSQFNFLGCFLVLPSSGDPGKPNNSAVVIQSENHWAGQYVWYFCNPGYTMIGPAIKRCFPSGKWTGYTPRCE